MIRSHDPQTSHQTDAAAFIHLFIHFPYNHPFICFSYNILYSIHQFSTETSTLSIHLSIYPPFVPPYIFIFVHPLIHPTIHPTIRQSIPVVCPSIHSHVHRLYNSFTNKLINTYVCNYNWFSHHSRCQLRVVYSSTPTTRIQFLSIPVSVLLPLPTWAPINARSTCTHRWLVIMRTRIRFVHRGTVLYM